MSNENCGQDCDEVRSEEDQAEQKKGTGDVVKKFESRCGLQVFHHVVSSDLIG